MKVGAGRPAARQSDEKGEMPAFAICVLSLVIFRVGTGLGPLPAVQSLCELRLLGKEVSGANTLLVRLQEAAYSRRR